MCATNCHKTRHCAQVATKLLTPICPHTCEHMWRGVLGHKNSSVLTAGFPEGKTTDFALQYAGMSPHAHADLLPGVLGILISPAKERALPLHSNCIPCKRVPVAFVSCDMAANRGMTGQEHLCCHVGDYLHAKVSELPRVRNNAWKMANKAAKGKKDAPAPVSACPSCYNCGRLHVVLWAKLKKQMISGII